MKMKKETKAALEIGTHKNKSKVCNKSGVGLDEKAYKRPV